MSLKKSAYKVAAAFLTAATSACTIIPPCNEACMLESSARVMTSSTDVGVRAAGAKTLMSIHPEIDKAGKEVRTQMKDAMASQKMVCTVSSVTVVNGQKEISLADCAKPQVPALTQ